MYTKKIIGLLTLLLAVASYYHISFANEAPENNEASKVKIERHFVFDTVPMNLKEITDAADRIFAGKCTKAEEKEHDGLPVFEYTFKVTEGIKGVTTDEITFRQWQPTVKDGGYTEGNKYILFLFPDSEKGLTSPVGFSQGKFDVEKTGLIRRKEVVRNSFNNRGLNRNLKTQKRITVNDTFLNDYVHRCSELGISMRYKEFVAVVKDLAKE